MARAVQGLSRKFKGLETDAVVLVDVDEPPAVFKIFCKRANCDAQMIPGA